RTNHKVGSRHAEPKFLQAIASCVGDGFGGGFLYVGTHGIGAASGLGSDRRPEFVARRRRWSAGHGLGARRERALAADVGKRPALSGAAAIGASSRAKSRSVATWRHPAWLPL